MDEFLTYQLSLEFLPDTVLQGMEAQIVQTMKQGKQVFFHDVTEAMEIQNLKRYRETHGPQYRLDVAKARLNQVISHGLTGSDANAYLSFKTEYENKISSYLKDGVGEGKIPGGYILNPEAVTFAYMIADKKLNAYSGTLFDQVLRRTAVTAKTFQEQNHVLIYTPGSVMSGRMEKKKDGYFLYGIDSTREGNGVREFGLAQNLSEPMIVVDADSAFLIELFRGRLANFDALESQLVQAASQKYGVPLNTWERAKAIRKATNIPLDKPNQMDGSPFSFGYLDEPAGDRPRS